MTAAYVPAVGLNGDEVYIFEGAVYFVGPTDEASDGWRRLYVREEPAAEPVGLVTLIHHLAYREPTDGAS